MGSHDSDERQEQGGLPGAVGAEERHPLALGDREGDTAQCFGAVRIGVGEVFDLEQHVHAVSMAATATTQAAAIQETAAVQRTGRLGAAAAGMTPV